MAHIAVSIMTNCAAIRHISGSHVAYSGTLCTATRYMFRQLMCIPTVSYKHSLWAWRPPRGGVSCLFGNSGDLTVKSGAIFSDPFMPAGYFVRLRSIGAHVDLLRSAPIALPSSSAAGLRGSEGPENRRARTNGDRKKAEADDDHPRRPLRSFCRRCGRDGRSLDGGLVVRAVTRVAAEAGRRQSRAMGRHHFPGLFQQLGAAAAGWRRKSPKGSENEGIFGGRCACCCRAACRASPVAWRMVRRRQQPVRCWPGRPRGRPRWPA
jgi:hypothetical protein